MSAGRGDGGCVGRGRVGRVGGECAGRGREVNVSADRANAVSAHADHGCAGHDRVDSGYAGRGREVNGRGDRGGGSDNEHVRWDSDCGICIARPFRRPRAGYTVPILPPCSAMKAVTTACAICDFDQEPL